MADHKSAVTTTTATAAATAVSSAAAAKAGGTAWLEPKWDKEAEKRLQADYWWDWTFEVDPNVLASTTIIAAPAAPSSSGGGGGGGGAPPLLDAVSVLHEMNHVLSSYKQNVRTLMRLKEQSERTKTANGGVFPDEKAAADLVDTAVSVAVATCRASADTVKSLALASADRSDRPSATSEQRDQRLVLAVRMFVDCVLSARAAVSATAARLDTIQNTPNPELVRVTQAVAADRARLEDVLAPMIRMRIPWPLFYVLFRKVQPQQSSQSQSQSQQQQKSDFEGGAIQNKDGSWANQIKCALLGHVIQYWDRGRYTKRYRCMDADRDHSAPIHEIVMSVIDTIRHHQQQSSGSSSSGSGSGSDGGSKPQTDTKSASPSSSSLLAAATIEFDRLSAELTRSVWCAEYDMNSGAWLKQPVQDSKTPAEFIDAACKQYAKRLCLGVRDEEVPNCVLGVDSMIRLNGYSWLTFEQVGLYARSLAMALRAPITAGGGLGIARQSLIGICGANQNEWLISDFACALAGCVIVGIHTTYDQFGVQSLIQNAQLTAVIASKHTLLPLFAEALASTTHSSSVQYLIVWEPKSTLSAEQQTALNSLSSAPRKLTVLFLSDLAERGRTLLLAADGGSRGSGASGSGGGGGFKLEPACEQPSTAPDSVFTLLYTSGSTGAPKGVVVSRHSFRTDIGSNITVQPLVGVSYIPLSHSSDRIRSWEFIGNGGRIGFASYGHSNWSEHELSKKHGMIESLIAGQYNNVHSLMSSIRLIRPVAFAGPPRIWNGLYNVYHTRCAQLKEQTASVLRTMHQTDPALEYAFAGLLPTTATGGSGGGGGSADPVLDQSAITAITSARIRERVRLEIVALFGGRLATIATGGAPTSPEVMQFIQFLFPASVCAFHESYGATECGAITENAMPRTGVALKLVDHPKQGFTSADKPWPRGEICVKTSTQAIGYYRNPQQTAESFDRDGWFHTGDLGTVDPVSGRVTVLDRISAVTSLAPSKLTSGLPVVICPSKLEAVYESSELVQNVFIYGDKSRSAVVAVVQPSGSGGEDKKVTVATASADVIRADFERIATAKSLRPYEVPIAVYVTSIDWSVETGLLNIHHKKMRSAIFARFESQIESLYTSLTTATTATTKQSN